MSRDIRIPVGRTSPKGVVASDNRDTPEVPGEVVTTDRRDLSDMAAATERELYRQSQREKPLLQRLRLDKESRTHLGNRVIALSKQPGFIAKAAGLAVFNSVMVLLVVISSNGLIDFSVILGLLLIDGYVVHKALSGAFKPHPVAPVDSVIPDRGFPKLKYFFLRVWGRSDIVPEVNKHQQAEVDEKLRLIEEAEAERVDREMHEEQQRTEREAEELAKTQYQLTWDRTRMIYNLGVHPTIAVVQQKGAGGKTFSSVNIGNMIADEVRCQVILMPGSASTQSATAGRVAGVKGNTLSQREFYDMLGSGADFNYRTLHKLIAKTPYGLSVIAEDGQGKWRSHFGHQKWGTIYKESSANTDVFIIDTGNEDALKDTVSTEAIKVSDVVLVPGSVDQEQTLDMVGSTIGNYAALDLFTEKLQRAVAVFHGVKPGEDMSRYTQILSEGLAEAEVDPKDFRDLMVCGIQWDDYLKRNSRGIDFKLMDEVTQLDYSAVILALFEQAAALQGVELPDRDPIIQDVGLVMSFGS